MSNVAIDNFNEAGGKLAGWLELYEGGSRRSKAFGSKARGGVYQLESHDGNFSRTTRRVASIADLFGRPIVWATKRIGDRLESLKLIRRGICIRFATLASIQLAAIKTNDCATYPSAPPCISPRALYSSDKRQPGRCRK